MYHGNSQNEQYIRCLIWAIYEQYGIAADNVVPANRGYYGETWKVCSGPDLYFLKIDYFPFHKERFRQSLAVLEYFCENGIDFTGKVIKTKNGAPYAKFNGAVTGLLEWVDRENIETDDTKPAEYQMLCEIYRLTRPGIKNFPRIVFR